MIRLKRGLIRRTEQMETMRALAGAIRLGNEDRWERGRRDHARMMDLDERQWRDSYSEDAGESHTQPTMEGHDAV